MTTLPIDTRARAWLEQFNLGDRPLAQKLLEAFALVSRDDFINHLRAMLIREAESINGPVGLYAERELGHRHGVPHRLFKEEGKAPRRAIGAAGPASVKPTKAYAPSVGSEGIVAQMISELCRERPKTFVDHPGPDQIRRKRVRAFWVVTDLIGSGNRVWRYLQAAWRVRSVRSWWSGDLVEFGVMAYASTEIGERIVVNHPCRPKVQIVIPCPTIDTAFSKGMAEKMKLLCETYDPTQDEPSGAPWARGGPSLGYGYGGALIAFAHGAPNNVPLIFHKASKTKGNTWVPLFPSRISAGIDKEAFGVGLTAKKIEARLNSLGQSTLARSKAVLNTDIPTAQVFLVLGALSHPPRLNNRVLSQRTGLPLYELLTLLREMTKHGWIDSQRRLTDQGAGQLAHARKQLRLATDAMPVGKQEPDPYYPSSLRHPI